MRERRFPAPWPVAQAAARYCPGERKLNKPSSRFEHGQHQHRFYAMPRYSSGKRLRLCETDRPI